MKFFSFLILSLLGTTLYAQHQSVGLRLGDPSGIYYKKYLANSATAIEVGGALVRSGWNNSYYRKSFSEYKRFSDDVYLNHNVKSNVYTQARFVRQYRLAVESLAGAVDWYWGAGVLMKIARVDYQYVNPTTTLVSNDVITDLDFGPEIPLGMEYTFEDVPLTIFTELSLFIELSNRKGHPSLFGGFGMRYNFYPKR